jgi:hypothetical protein
LARFFLAAFALLIRVIKESTLSSNSVPSSSKKSKNDYITFRQLVLQGLGLHHPMFLLIW